jgi:putative ABC transport system ATP-binding protein
MTEHAGGHAVLEAVELMRVYGAGSGGETYALAGVSFRVDEGDFVAIIGPSGSGKSTLLNLIGALDRPSSGSVLIDGIDVSRLSNKELAKTRNKKIGFVFQSFNLIGRLSAVENVEVPLLVAGTPPKERRRIAMKLLDEFGIASRADHKPNELSGGEQQRVAVARSLVTDPLVVLADEPTGNLDTRNTDLVMDILEKLNKGMRKTLVVITHNTEVAYRAKKIISMRDGKIEKEVRNE